jgi:N-acetylglucosamine kinase-like BadF-type ATPase
VPRNPLLSGRLQRAFSAVNEKLAIGVDGGGTKTVAWLARASSEGEPEVLGRGLAGSSNWRAIGRDKALENLFHSVESAWRDAGLDFGTVESAVLALAGAGQADVQAQVSDWAHGRGVAK